MAFDITCNECGHTYKGVNGDYNYCPYCGNLIVESIYERYFSNKTAIAYNWHLLKHLFDGDLLFVERIKLLDKPYTYLFTEDYL